MILVTGAAGFIGRTMVETLSQEYEVRGMVFDEADKHIVEEHGGEPVQGDVTNPESLEDAMDGVDRIVHLVGIIDGTQQEFEEVHVGGTQHLLDAADDLDRFVYFSALGAGTASTPYFATKLQAEQRIKESSHPYTIFRPSIVFGSDDMFINLLIDQVQRLPIAPVLGDGGYRLQPIYVKDAAHIVEESLTKETCRNQTYEIGGPGVLTLEQIMDTILTGLDLHKPKVHIPLRLAKVGAPIARSVMQVPLSDTTLTMLEQENYVKEHHYTDVFDVTLHSFDDMFDQLYGD